MGEFFVGFGVRYIASGGNVKIMDGDAIRRASLGSEGNADMPTIVFIGKYPRVLADKG